MADIQVLKEKVQREIDEIAPLLIECSDYPYIPGLKDFYGNHRVPALNFSGWYDIFLWGTFQNYDVAHPSRLVLPIVER